MRSHFDTAPRVLRSFYCRWVMFDTMERNSVFGNWWPCRIKSQKENETHFLGECSNVQVLMNSDLYISEGRGKKGLRESFKNNRTCLSFAKPLQKAWAMCVLYFSKHFWSGRSMRAVLRHRYWQGNLKPPARTGWPCPSCFFLQNNDAEGEQVPSSRTSTQVQMADIKEL